MLNWVKGSAKQGRLLLPPPTLGGTISSEIVAAYEKYNIDLQKTQLDNSDPLVVSGEESVTIGMNAASVDELQPTVQPSDSPNVLAYSSIPHLDTNALASNLELSAIDCLSGMTQGAFSNCPDVAPSPVTSAIARYMGIDISAETAEAKNKLGVAIIVHGPSFSGQTTQARSLSEEYNVPVLVLNDLIISAISSANTPAGCKAREYCIKEAEMKTTNELSETPTAQGVVTKKQDNAKDKYKDMEKEQPETVPSSRPPVLFNVEVLEDTPYVIPEGTLVSTFLPEDIVLEILSDRLQHADCSRGVIFDGVESHFTPSSVVSTTLLLRSFSNRAHIYFVHLQIKCESIEMRLKEIEEAKEKEAFELKMAMKEKKAEEKRRREKLLEMDEDKYEELSLEKQEEIEQYRLQRKREIRERKRLEKEEKIKEERELEEMRLEEEKLKKKGRKDPNKRLTNVAKPVTSLPPQDLTIAAVARLGSVQSPHQGGTVTSSSQSIISEADLPGGTKKKMTKKPSGRVQSIMEDCNDDGKPCTQLERNYRYYSDNNDAVKCLLENWDRQKCIIRPKKQTELEEQTLKTNPNRKGKGGKQKEEPIIINPIPETPSVDESKEGLGIPLIDVKASKPKDEITKDMLENGLPSSMSILKEMGLTDSKPPIAQPITFQVYPIPLKRRALDPITKDRFSFIAASPDDP